MSIFGTNLNSPLFGPIAASAQLPSGAELDLDYTRHLQDTRATLTRASAGWYYNSAGALVEAAINESRFDHNPATLRPRGLRIEPASTNLLLNSATLSTQNVTVTAVAHTISFLGTGSITLSGAATGTLNGTGANNLVSLTFTPSAGALTVTVSGSVLEGQLELGDVATSRIRTAGTAVTRAADVAQIPLTSFNFNAAQGTLLVEFEFAGVSGNQSIVILDNGATSNRFRLRQISTGTFWVVTTASSDVAAINFSGGAANTVYRTASAYAVDDYALSRNGGTVVTDTLGALPTGLTTLRLGCDNAGANQLNGWLRRVVYYPTRLPNSTLQALAA